MKPEGWEKQLLGNLCRFQAGSAFPQKYQGLAAGDFPFIKVSDMNLSSNEIHINDANNWVTKDLASELKAKPLPAGTPVFAKIGEALKHNRIRFLVRDTVMDNNMMGAIPNTSIVDGRFLYYLLGQIGLPHLATGTAVPYLTVSVLSQVNVELPPLLAQRRIASVLTAYDDLIENNTRRIAVLEEMARRLYEEWFVHFRFPGHENVRMVESEIGEVPEGWEIVYLESVAAVNPESIKPRGAPETINYIDISSVSPGRVDTVQTMAFSDAPSRARRRVQSGDLLWSCVRPNRRSHALILDPEPDTIASTGFAVLRATNIPFSYLYQAVTTDEFVAYLVNHATGAAYPAVKQSDFDAAKITLPPGQMLEEFSEIIEPMLRLTHALERKNANLRTQRDLLLPKLISGEIDVSEASEPSEEVEAA